MLLKRSRTVPGLTGPGLQYNVVWVSRDKGRHKAGSWSACLLVRLLRKAELPHIQPNYFIPSPISPANASEIFPRPVSGWMIPYDSKTTYGVVPCSALVLCLYAMTLCRIDWHIFDKVMEKLRAAPTSKYVNSSWISLNVNLTLETFSISRNWSAKRTRDIQRRCVSKRKVPIECPKTDSIFTNRKSQQIRASTNYSKSGNLLPPSPMQLGQRRGSRARFL